MPDDEKVETVTPPQLPLDAVVEAEVESLQIAEAMWERQTIALEKIAACLERIEKAFEDSEPITPDPHGA